MSKLTLEQVRDAIRSSHIDLDVYPSHKIRLEWADAIDAALKAQGEPVAPADDRPTWEEARNLVAEGMRSDWAYLSIDDAADRIIAEFRKEKGK